MPRRTEDYNFSELALMASGRVPVAHVSGTVSWTRRPDGILLKIADLYLRSANGVSVEVTEDETLFDVVFEALEREAVAIHHTPLDKPDEESAPSPETP